MQLPFAGVEGFVDVLDRSRTWTCAKGAYSEPTAEHALALVLAGLRRLPARARTTSWGAQGVATLYDAPVVVLGGGGITASLLELLAPFRCAVTVVRRSPEQMRGSSRTVRPERLDEVLADALVVVLALALTPETTHVISRRQLAAMSTSAWLVNVARGRHVDTDALVTALQEGAIGGAALDVTDPEPLPDGHRCGPCPTASSRRTPPTRGRPRSRSWRGACTTTCSGSPRAGRSSAPSISTPATDLGQASLSAWPGQYMVTS